MVARLLGVIGGEQVVIQFGGQLGLLGVLTACTLYTVQCTLLAIEYTKCTEQSLECALLCTEYSVN